MGGGERPGVDQGVGVDQLSHTYVTVTLTQNLHPGLSGGSPEEKLHLCELVMVMC